MLDKVYLFRLCTKIDQGKKHLEKLLFAESGPKSGQVLAGYLAGFAGDFEPFEISFCLQSDRIVMWQSLFFRGSFLFILFYFIFASVEAFEHYIVIRNDLACV